MELAEYRRMYVEDTHWWYRSTSLLLQQLLEHLLPPGGRYLDVGCGTGATGAWMAARGELVAADFEPVALPLHRERHAASHVVACDGSTLPFAAALSDAVLCVTMLCHRSITSPTDVVAEMARVLRPGGVLRLWEPGVRRVWRAHDRETHSARRFSRRELATMLTENGLHVERSTGADAYLVPPAAVKSLVERGESSSDLDRNLLGWGCALGGGDGRTTTAPTCRPPRRSVRHRDRPPVLIR